MTRCATEAPTIAGGPPSLCTRRRPDRPTRLPRAASATAAVGAALVAALALVAAAPAGAATVRVEGSTLMIVDGHGESNILTVKRIADDTAGKQVVLVRDRVDVEVPDPPFPFNLLPGNPIVPGTGCKATGGDAREVRCSPVSEPCAGCASGFTEGKSFTGVTATLGGDRDFFARTQHSLALPPITADGGPGDDVVRGGPAADVLRGGDGDDELQGKEGDDVLSGGMGGADELAGGAGTDTVDYSASSVPLVLTIDGSSNDGAGCVAADAQPKGCEKDRIMPDVEDVIGGSHDDVLLGSAVVNRLVGNGGGDLLMGRGGNDRVDGGTGDDRVVGGDGDDVLTAGDGADDALGGPGDDTIDAGGGRNVVHGDDGHDKLVGGGGPDVVDAGAGDDLVAAGAGDDLVEGRAGADHLNAGAGNDQLDGNAGSDDLRGEAGDDLLRGGDGSDVLSAGDGSDTVSYEEKAGPVFAEAGSGSYGEHCAVPGDPACEGDRITAAENFVGGAGDDRLAGSPTGSEANRLEGRGGNDDLDGAAGNDDLRGGAGDDALRGGGGGDRLEGGEGYDATSYRASPSGVEVVLDGRPGDGAKDEGDNVLGDVEQVQGSFFDDVLVGSDARNDLYGGAGDDDLSGLAGPDLLRGGDGLDAVSYSGRSADLVITLNDQPGDGDATDGGEGDDVGADVEGVAGGSGNDTIIGSQVLDTANRLDGQGGNDLLDGGLGADDLRGGPGTDTVRYNRASHEHVVVTIDGDGDDGAFDPATGSTVEGDNVDTDVENLQGGLQRDVLEGSPEPNVLDGGAGDDLLDGLQSDDVLIGGGGDDALDGGAGNDRLKGDAGADRLTGGGGNDDAVDYSDRTTVVSVTFFDGVANDGEPGEGDLADDSNERVLFPSFQSGPGA